MSTPVDFVRSPGGVTNAASMTVTVESLASRSATGAAGVTGAGRAATCCLISGALGVTGAAASDGSSSSAWTE